MGDIGDYWREHKEHVAQKKKEPNVDWFEEGQLVTYIPYHAKGNINHPDCEQGRVTSKNEKYVFVRFGNSSTSQACPPDQLK